MHPEIRQEKPGICPKCGIILEVIASAAVAFSSVSVILNLPRLKKVKTKSFSFGPCQLRQK